MYILYAVLVTALVAYPAGILTAKYVIADTLEIKSHVSVELGKLRTEIQADLAKIIAKI